METPNDATKILTIDGLALLIDHTAARISLGEDGHEVTFVSHPKAHISKEIPLSTVVIACFANECLRGIPQGFERVLQLVGDDFRGSIAISREAGDAVRVIVEGATPAEIVLQRQPDLFEPAYSLDEFFDPVSAEIQKFATGRSLAPLPRQFFTDRIQLIRELMARGGLGAVIALPPLMITVGITDQCNLQCTMCFRKRKGYVPNRYIFPDQVLRNLVLDLGSMGVRGLRFCGEGENALHPKFLENLMLAKVVGLRTFLITNGTMLVRSYQVIDRCLDFLRVSFNALSPEGYMAIHGVTNYQLYFQVLEGITAVRRERDRLAWHLPIVTISCVILEDSIQYALHGRLVDDLQSVGLNFLVLKSDRLWTMGPQDEERYGQIIAHFEASGIRVTDYSDHGSSATPSRGYWEEEAGIGCIVRLMRANIDRFEVHSCVSEHEIYGIITQERFPAIWASNQRVALQRRRAIAPLKRCDQCFWGDFHRLMNDFASRG